MKTLLQILFFSLFVTQMCFAQWLLQNQSTNYPLSNVKFISTTVGWAVGDYGTIIKTTDGGTNWTPQTSGTTNFFMVYHLPMQIMERPLV